MIQVSVTSTEVRNMRGTAKTSGRAYDLNFQDAWFYTVDRHGQVAPYPEKVEIILEKNEQGAPLFYPVGQYTLDPSSIYVSRNRDLSISPRLIPARPAPAVKG